MNLKEKTVNSVAWSFVQMIGTKLVSVGTFFVLAKILDPKAFGTVAIIFSINQFGSLFIEAGIGAAIIQKKDLLEDHKNVAFWFNMSFAVVIYSTLFLLAPTIASFYEDPNLTTYIRISSLSFIILPSSVVHAAILKRKFLFNKIALSRIIGVFTGSTLGISLAVSGFGVWSLILQTLCITSCYTVMIWIFSPWFPGLKFTKTAFKEIFSFSYKVQLHHVSTKIGTSAPALIIGYFLGMEAVGIYSFCMRIFTSTIELVNYAINNTMVSVFSSIQNNQEKLKSLFLRIVEAVLTILVPISVMIVFWGPPAIEFVFGEKWIEANSILGMMIVGGTIYSMCSYFISISLSIGRPEITLRFSFVSAILLTTLIFMGSKESLLWVGIARLVHPILLLPLFLYFINRLFGIKTISFFKNLVKPALIGLILTGIFLLTSMVSVESSAIFLAIQVIVIGITLALILMYMPIDLVTQAKNYLNNKSLIKK
jgi:O-antigen/teichoic acid export membrane protein